MKKIVLVHCISNLEVGGAQAVLYQLLQRLPEHLFEHKIIYFREGPYVEMIKTLGIEMHQIKGALCPYDPLFLYRFFSLIKLLKPDCLHTMLWAANALGRYVAWKYALPLVQVLHNNQDQNGFLRACLDKILPQSTGPIVAVSDGVKESAFTHAPWFLKHTICVIPNGIDVFELQKKASAEHITRYELGLDQDQFLIGTVGRFEPVKNYSFLLTAFAVLYDKYQKERLMLIGQGSQESFLRQRAYDLGIEKHVQFVIGKPAYRYYQLFDCFVMTSFKEGLSIALLEAMSFGLPCIITCDTLKHDVVEHDVNGLLVQSGDPELLAQAIDSLAQNVDLRKRLGLQAQATVQKLFPVETMIHGYKEIYKKVVHEAHGKMQH